MPPKAHYAQRSVDGKRLRRKNQQGENTSQQRLEIVMNKNSPKRSRYDELHDKYHSIRTTKAGTRYERLAAMVFKALEDKNIVIHDMALRGDDPEVKHQIDVTVEISGSKRRVIIECKDFDISGENVGLDIIRNFRSVIEDTQADEGFVLTCNSFTVDAQKYARSKGIKLCVLRLFEDKDLNGRITRAFVGVTLQQPSNPKVSILIDEIEQPRYARELAAIGISEGARNTDPIFFVRGAERHQFNEFLTSQMNDAIKPAGPRAIQITVPSDGRQIQVDQNLPIPFRGLVVNFDVDEETHTLEVTSERVAELILSGMGNGDMIIFGDRIERRSIDPLSGAVI
jgi:hypothetical protein